jgi:DnaJ-class molecular chaperone
MDLGAQVEPHPVFMRDGDDIHLTADVGMAEAALGTEIRRVDVGAQPSACRRQLSAVSL